LADLIEACRAYPLRPWKKLTFEYALLKGVTIRMPMRAACQLLAHINAKVI